MSTPKHAWTLMRIDDAPDDAVGVAIVKDGLVWLAVARGVLWPEPAKYLGGLEVAPDNIMDMRLGNEDVRSLINAKILEDQTVHVGMAMGAAPLTRVFCDTEPNKLHDLNLVGLGDDEEYDLRLSGSGLRIAGPALICIVPDGGSARALNVHPTQPLCFRASSMRRIVLDEIASVRRGPEGLCPMCHAPEDRVDELFGTCECEARVPSPRSEWEEQACVTGGRRQLMSSALTDLRMLQVSQGIPTFNPEDPTADDENVPITYRRMREFLMEAAKLMGLREENAITGERRRIADQAAKRARKALDRMRSRGAPRVLLEGLRRSIEQSHDGLCKGAYFDDQKGED